MSVLIVSSCASIKPDTQGYDGQTLYDVVPNPNWNPAIDPYSKDYPSEIVFTVDSSDVDIYNKVEAGQLFRRHTPKGSSFVEKLRVVGL